MMRARRLSPKAGLPASLPVPNGLGCLVVSWSYLFLFHATNIGIISQICSEKGLKNALKTKKVCGRCDKFGGHDPILSQFWSFVATNPSEMKRNNCFACKTPVPLHRHTERFNHQTNNNLYIFLDLSEEICPIHLQGWSDLFLLAPLPLIALRARN